ncbi:MAG TPA: tyrosine-type recombinase/integrase [Treponemataceae bacterium]|nr:tyrosine-type recombinase/integrase [Treponemataceae bacterium]
MRSFYLFKRNGGIFYVRFVDPVTKKLCTARSTGKLLKDEALVQVYEWLYSNTVQKTKDSPAKRFMSLLTQKKLNLDEVLEIQQAISAFYPSVIPSSIHPVSASLAVSVSPASSGTLVSSPSLLSYLRYFWDFEKSDYVQDKIYHGQRIGQRHCYEMVNRVKYWVAFFSKDFTLRDLTTLKIQEFEKSLRGKNISTLTMNNIIKCGSIAFKWAVRQKLLDENPFEGITAYSINSKERGILTNEEAGKLFRIGMWSDERAMVANKLAMTTGLRMGEILALRKNDIGEDRLFIRHSWSPLDGLKSTKTGIEREVPLLTEIRTLLFTLLLQNPHRAEGESFIFWGNLPTKPVVQNVITEGLKAALESIDIGDKEREERNIVFHSWRHFYATVISNNVGERKAQIALGHLTPAMTKHYAAHKREEDLQQVADASAQIFSSLLA